MNITFDTSLSIVVEILKSHLELFTQPVTLMRHTNGRLAVIVKSFTGNNERIDSLAQQLDITLNAYSPGKESVLVSESDLLDASELADRIRIEDEQLDLWLLDKLLTNQDWLKPLISTLSIPLVVGYSIKGGVGRSVALSFFARHLSSLGKRVVLVDLDLEAPGLGALHGVESNYGVTDWLMESIVNNSTQSLSEDFYFRVPHLSAGSGAVFCVPAWGNHSKNYVAKLGRVYLTTLSGNGEWFGLADRLHGLMNAIIESEGIVPDAIIVDTRAGLHDLGSAMVTRLGAEVMLFARDEPQSWEGYRKLFEYIRQSRQIQWGHQEEDLRCRLKMVAAQIDPTEEAFDEFKKASFDVWLDFYDFEDYTASDGRNSTFNSDDENAPHYPTPINFSDALRGFQGWVSGKTIREDILKPAFDKFCSLWTSRIGFGEDI
jgi:MinD-like ATPase involved in chromosome partitioning or flagellar assembly